MRFPSTPGVVLRVPWGAKTQKTRRCSCILATRNDFLDDFK